MHTHSDLNFFCHTAPFFSEQTKTANSAHTLQCISLYCVVFQYFYFFIHSTVQCSVRMKKICVFLLTIMDSLLQSCHNVEKLGSIESIERRIYKRI